MTPNTRKALRRIFATFILRMLVILGDVVTLTAFVGILKFFSWFLDFERIQLFGIPMETVIDFMQLFVLLAFGILMASRVLSMSRDSRD
jgi:hypothetical protein